MHRLLRGNRGRSAEGAATIEQVRHRAMGSAGEWRSGRHLLARKALAWAERPPLWGSDDVSAMRNYRYRHRDSPYVAMRSGERTSRSGRPWAVGGELPGARWRGRPVCARGGRPCGGSGGTNARVSVFFIHIHPRLRRGAPAGRKGGPISSASGSFSSLCWSWGRRARRRRRGAACARRRRGAACARRGEEHRPCGAARGRAQGCETELRSVGYDSRSGVKPNCAAWAMIRAAG